jgi:hypothetical protein
MDKIIKTTLGIFIVILVVFVAVVAYSSYVSTAYQNSRVSTYMYSCTLTTDSVLTNVTLFLPIPEMVNGESSIVVQIGAQKVSGIPADWKTALFGTGKTTLLKVSAAKIGEPAVNGVPVNTTITFTTTATSPWSIDTRSPIANAAVFRPVQDLQEAACPETNAGAAGSSTPSCSSYLTSIYASYDAPLSASVSISSTVTGTNAWTVFKPESNQYENRIALLMHGDNHGWATTRGWIESGIGSFDTHVIQSP